MSLLWGARLIWVKVSVKIIADDWMTFLNFFFFFFFLRKHGLTFHMNCLPRQMIHMKYQALFSQTKIFKNVIYYWSDWCFMGYSDQDHTGLTMSSLFTYTLEKSFLRVLLLYHDHVTLERQRDGMVETHVWTNSAELDKTAYVHN